MTERMIENRVKKLFTLESRIAELQEQAEAGIDPKVLQVIMGHSDPAVTMKVYNHVDQERMKKEIREI